MQPSLEIKEPLPREEGILLLREMSCSGSHGVLLMQMKDFSLLSSDWLMHMPCWELFSLTGWSQTASICQLQLFRSKDCIKVKHLLIDFHSMSKNSACDCLPLPHCHPASNLLLPSVNLREFILFWQGEISKLCQSILPALWVRSYSVKIESFYDLKYQLLATLLLALLGLLVWREKLDQHSEPKILLCRVANSLSPSIRSLLIKWSFLGQCPFLAVGKHYNEFTK